MRAVFERYILSYFTAQFSWGQIFANSGGLIIHLEHFNGKFHIAICERWITSKIMYEIRGIPEISNIPPHTHLVDPIYFLSLVATTGQVFQNKIRLLRVCVGGVWNWKFRCLECIEDIPAIRPDFFENLNIFETIFYIRRPAAIVNIAKFPRPGFFFIDLTRGRPPP